MFQGGLGQEVNESRAKPLALILVHDLDRHLGVVRHRSDPNIPGDSDRIRPGVVNDECTPGEMVLVIDLGQVSQLSPGEPGLRMILSMCCAYSEEDLAGARPLW